MQRADFLKLTGMGEEAFKILSRRNQLPIVSNDGRGVNHRGGYTAFEALLCLVCNDFVDKMHGDRTNAAELVARQAQDIQRNFNRIKLSVFDPAAPVIFCGTLWLVGIGERPFCGSLLDLSSQREVVSSAITSASEAFAVLMERAQESSADIDPEFWLLDSELPRD